MTNDNMFKCLETFLALLFAIGILVGAITTLFGVMVARLFI